MRQLDQAEKLKFDMSEQAKRRKNDQPTPGFLCACLVIVTMCILQARLLTNFMHRARSEQWAQQRKRRMAQGLMVGDSGELRF